MTTRISIIAAVTRDGGLGHKGNLLYRISDDMKHFKAVTMGKPIIMGRKTFESFPKGALPGRRNIVVTRNASYNAPGIEIATSLDEAINMTAASDEAMIIGGGEIYRQAMPHASRIYLTQIDADYPDADTRFPEIDATRWDVTQQSEAATDPRSGVNYRFVTLDRK